jgi:hypothetical protein
LASASGIGKLGIKVPPEHEYCVAAKSSEARGLTQNGATSFRGCHEFSIMSSVQMKPIER